jgi:hypothetical protein
MHFNKNAAQTPHINCHVILPSQQHLWRAVEPALYILINLQQNMMNSKSHHSYMPSL